MHGEAPICLYAYTVISGVFDDVDNSIRQYFELCHYYSKLATYF